MPACCIVVCFSSFEGSSNSFVTKNHVEVFFSTKPVCPDEQQYRTTYRVSLAQSHAAVLESVRCSDLHSMNIVGNDSSGQRVCFPDGGFAGDTTFPHSFATAKTTTFDSLQ